MVIFSLKILLLSIIQLLKINTRWSTTYTQASAFIYSSSSGERRFSKQTKKYVHTRIRFKFMVRGTRLEPGHLPEKVFNSTLGFSSSK